MRYTIILAVMLCLFSGCPNETEEKSSKSDLNVRCSIVPATSGSLKISAFLEGPGGNSVTGALVNVIDSTNQVTQLLYDYTSYSYTARIDENTGIYNFEITSILLDNPLIIDVPYTMITRSPDITFFQDSDGNSVLSGSDIDSGLPVQIGWTSCGEDMTYQIIARTALRTLYTANTNAETITVPSGTIPQGTYTLTISAQKIHGDPLYKTANYYSISSASSVGVSFNVN